MGSFPLEVGVKKGGLAGRSTPHGSSRAHLLTCIFKQALTPMAHLFVALFLIVFGLNILIGLSLPMWLIGLLAIIAGVLLVMEHFRIRVDRK